MKKTFGKIIVTVIIAMGIAFGLSGCYESHYYGHYHHHTRGWYDHRHAAPPAGVNFDVDVDLHRHHRG